jgi:hypothetical protein
MMINYKVEYTKSDEREIYYTAGRLRWLEELLHGRAVEQA